MFCQHFWTSQQINQLEILANFLYDTIQEDDIDYPLWLTIDNVIHREDDNLYAACFSFCVNLFEACMQCNLAIIGEVCEQSLI